MAATGKSTRERLLEATAELARLKGFDRTSVADVLAAAGVGKGSFFHYFPDKNSLGLAVLETDREKFMLMLDDCLAAPGSPLARLERFFAVALETHRACGFSGGCPWGNTALEMSDTNPDFTALVNRVFDDWTAKLAVTIAAAQEQGQVRTDLLAQELARAAVAMIEGGIMLSRLKKDETPMRECLKALRLFLICQ